MLSSTGFKKTRFRYLATLAVLSLLSIAVFSKPLPTKPLPGIIIDTDCAIDDMRAISLLLSRPEIIIKAIVVTEGSLAPADGVFKVRQLLTDFGKEFIPVFEGNIINGEVPPWRSFNKGIEWGKTSVYPYSHGNLTDLTNFISSSEEQSLIYVALGPLTSLANLNEKQPNILKSIKKILWYAAVQPLSGFNYKYDSLSAKKIISSETRMDIISNLNYTSVQFDSSFISICKLSNTPLAKQLLFVHEQKQVAMILNSGHFQLYDELLAVYIIQPELFDLQPDKKKVWIRNLSAYNLPAVREVLYDMIMGNYVPDRNIVFNRFPQDRLLFSYDVRQIMDTALNLYGAEEWKACVITDEFHGHLGVFSIVGAKMGLRAKEYFGVGPDQLVVESFAGSQPPYSCLNDGLQVSTGATLGMGTIHISNDTIIQPSAIFTYNGKSIQLALKPEFVNKVNTDIREGIVKFGLLDDGYWKMIRRNALKYWVEWDRNSIFDLIVLH